MQLCCHLARKYEKALHGLRGTKIAVPAPVVMIISVTQIHLIVISLALDVISVRN